MKLVMCCACLDVRAPDPTPTGQPVSCRCGAVSARFEGPLLHVTTANREAVRILCLHNDAIGFSLDPRSTQTGNMGWKNVTSEIAGRALNTIYHNWQRGNWAALCRPLEVAGIEWEQPAESPVKRKRGRPRKAAPAEEVTHQ